MSIHCQAMSDWFELSIRHSVIYDEITMTYPIHVWSPLCSTHNNTRCSTNMRKGGNILPSFLLDDCLVHVAPKGALQAVGRRC